MKGDILVAYQFDGRELHPIHGFPLRITAPGKVVAFWVKWLGGNTFRITLWLDSSPLTIKLFKYEQY
ncbi:MAG: molybdopterin-dependent oxidoreductase [Spirochaetia bacterium]|jgi:DMSO/TMAO reductase YedYZ molybdopterin-dependent catalytic subunit|nr:molybdopterin-dependent oxidoreductase [Spirochaetia bacterium]